MSPLPGHDHAVEVVAMKRSGQHAVMHWMLSQVDGDAVHLNNCEFIVATHHTNPPPRVVGLTVRHVHFGAFSSAFYRGGSFLGHIRHVEPNEEFSSHLDRIRALQNVEHALRGAHGAGRLSMLAFNFEDLHLDAWRALPGDLVDRGPEDRRSRVVVLRDLSNFVASRLAGGYLVTPAVVDAWRSHVAAALAAPAGDPVVYVDFPAWHRSEDYRRALALRLGLRFSDRGRDDVPPFGPPPAPGSSFDGLAMHGRGREMRVTERWRSFTEDPRWRAVCLDPSLRALSEARFGPPEELR